MVPRLFFTLLKFHRKNISYSDKFFSFKMNVHHSCLCSYETVFHCFFTFNFICSKILFLWYILVVPMLVFTLLKFLRKNISYSNKFFSFKTNYSSWVSCFYEIVFYCCFFTFNFICSKQLFLWDLLCGT